MMFDLLKNKINLDIRNDNGKKQQHRWPWPFFFAVARAEGSSVEWKIDMFYWSYIEHSNWQLAIVSENTFNRCSPIHGIGNVYS